MKKRIAVIMLSVAVLIICMAAAMTGCKDKGNECADLVALRINNHMAEWVDSNYNFDYKGAGELNVTVPYTNFLKVNDLIVSPGASATVYEDEACTAEVVIEDRYVFIDVSTTLYIKVVNNKKSNIYKVNVASKQTNIPDNIDISAKRYSNLGGHIYIPEGVTEVEIEGINYYVIDRMEYEEFERILSPHTKNYILSKDRGSNYLRYLDRPFVGIFDGNGYEIELIDSFREDRDGIAQEIDVIGKNGVVKNLITTATYMRINENDERVPYVHVNCRRTALLCRENYGTIDNVYNRVCIDDDRTRFTDGNDGEYVHKIAVFADINGGVISNCINIGHIKGYDSDSKIRQFSVFSNEMRGEQFDFSGDAKIINCVNTGDIDYGTTANGVHHGSGAFVIASIADAYVQVDGVYNLGNIQSSNIKRKYSRYFASATTACEDGKSRDVDCSKIKDYTK